MLLLSKVEDSDKKKKITNSLHENSHSRAGFFRFLLLTNLVVKLCTQHSKLIYLFWEFGPCLLPPFACFRTKYLLYLLRKPATPVGFFLFSVGSTFGVAFRTLPARDREPCTLPMKSCFLQKIVRKKGKMEQKMSIA